MLYIRSSLHSIFYCILAKSSKILSNSRTLGESWGFHCFHIWILSNIEMRIICFNYFSLQKYWCNIPNFQFGMLYIRSSMHIIFYFAFWLILEILRNSMTHGESWGFHYFHIWVFSNFENRIIWFYLFYHQLFPLQKYERGNKMTFPK